MLLYNLPPAAKKRDKFISIFWLTHEKINLPRQEVSIQAMLCVINPEQGFPLYLGSGLLQVRFRVDSPGPQKREHDHSLQPPQAPWTTRHAQREVQRWPIMVIANEFT